MKLIKNKQELQQLCAELNMSIPDFVEPHFINKEFKTNQDMKNALTMFSEVLSNQKNAQVIESLKTLFNAKLPTTMLPLYGSNVSCGFTSPAEDHVDNQLSLDEFLVPNPNATFFVRATGESMINAGIHDGDLLVIDRSVNPVHNNIVLAIVDTEFTVKRLIKDNERIILRAENPLFDDMPIKNAQHFMVWGVVLHVIHHLK